MNTPTVHLFDLTTLLFGTASVNYVAYLYGKRETLARIGTWICLAAAVVSTAALGVRWAESYQMGIGRIPVSNLYESLVFFAWSVNLFYLFVEWKYKNRTFGAFVIPIAFLTMVFAFTSESSIQPLVPDRGDHHRRGMGELCLGNVLVVGPEGDVVAHRLARLRGVPPRPDHPGVAREAGGHPVARGFFSNPFLLPGRQLGPVGPPQLRKLKGDTKGEKGHQAQISGPPLDCHAGGDAGRPAAGGLRGGGGKPRGVGVPPGL